MQNRKNLAAQIQAGITANANRYKMSYVPVFKIDVRDKPYHCGTMFSVSHMGNSFLVTAAHVLERDQKNPRDLDSQIYGFTDGRIVQIGKFLTANLTLPSRENLDLRIMSPIGLASSDFVAEPIPASNIWCGNMLRDFYVVACGFPKTKNRRKGRELTMRPYGYFGKIANEKLVSAEGYDPMFHFGIEIDLKRVYREGLNQIKAVEPDGISGGPVFVVHDFSRANVSIEPRLVGVVIARAKNSKMLICVRGEFLIHVIDVIENDQVGTEHKRTGSGSLTDPT